MYSFASDYLEGCHPALLNRLAETNGEQTPGYGLDPFCVQAEGEVRRVFACPEADVHFLVGGTQANATVLSAMLRPYEGVLCAATGHINVHETGAVEATGHKVLPLEGRDGKIPAAQVSAAVALQGNDEHIVRPGAVYISLSTELGTVYSLRELEALHSACQECGLFLYVDGARLGYALCSPANDLPLAALAKHADAFTVGGTKQGALFGEAVVICHPALKRHFRYMMKRAGAMLAKGRLLGIQFAELLRPLKDSAGADPRDNLYFTLAERAVAQAMRIRDTLLARGLPLYVDALTNQLFPILSDAQREALEKDFVFSPWERIDDSRTVIRICTSWCTPDSAVDDLMAAIERLA